MVQVDHMNNIRKIKLLLHVQSAPLYSFISSSTIMTHLPSTYLLLHIRFYLLHNTPNILSTHRSQLPFQEDLNKGGGAEKSKINKSIIYRLKPIVNKK